MSRFSSSFCYQISFIEKNLNNVHELIWDAFDGENLLNLFDFIVSFYGPEYLRFLKSLYHNMDPSFIKEITFLMHHFTLWGMYDTYKNDSLETLCKLLQMNENKLDFIVNLRDFIINLINEPLYYKISSLIKEEHDNISQLLTCSSLGIRSNYRFIDDFIINAFVCHTFPKIVAFQAYENNTIFFISHTKLTVLLISKILSQLGFTSDIKQTEEYVINDDLQKHIKLFVSHDSDFRNMYIQNLNYESYRQALYLCNKNYIFRKFIDYYHKCTLARHRFQPRL